MAEVRSSGGLPIGYIDGSPMYESPIYVPKDPDYPGPTFKIPTPRSLPMYDVSIPTSTTGSNNAEDETSFYSTSRVSPVYIPKSYLYPESPIYIPTAINQPTYDVPTGSSNAEDETPFYSTSRVSPVYIPKSYLYPESPIYIPTAINQPTYDVPTTTANNAQGPPPPSTTTTPKTFEMEAQAYNSQQHNHQRGEGEEQPMKKPSSSGAVPPMPQGLGCIEEQPRITFPSFIDVVLDSDFTVEEREIYEKIVCESNGFDCPYIRPAINVPGMLKPYPLEKISDVKRMEIDYMADLALKHYNYLNGSSYQLVEVIKATLRYSVGCTFNITLRAKDDKSGSPPHNFQARVYDSMGKYKVLFCRVEGNAAQAYNSQQHNHQRGEGEEQPMKKPSSSGAVPPMPQGLGCIEEQPRIPFPSFIDVVLDSDFTTEEGEIYDKICVESDGFDCPYVRPEIKIPGLLKPYPLENISDVERMEVDYMADLALKHYNDLNGSSYQLVEVIKATLRFSNGCIFNITLRAKDDKSGSPPQNFQARVYDSTDKYKVLFCRVEGNAEPTAIGDSDKHSGCWVPKPPIFVPVGYSSSGRLMYGSSSDVPATTANST